MSKLALATVVILATLAVIKPAMARPAQCEITADSSYKGACDFDPFGGDGSFSLSVKGQTEILPQISTLIVRIVAAGVAVIEEENSSGAGHGYFDGAFVRSKAQPSCWEQKGVMTEFRVCVR